MAFAKYTAPGLTLDEGKEISESSAEAACTI